MMITFDDDYLFCCAVDESVCHNGKELAVIQKGRQNLSKVYSIFSVSLFLSMRDAHLTHFPCSCCYVIEENSYPGNSLSQGQDPNGRIKSVTVVKVVREQLLVRPTNVFLLSPFNNSITCRILFPSCVMVVCQLGETEIERSGSSKKRKDSCNKKSILVVSLDVIFLKSFLNHLSNLSIPPEIINQQFINRSFISYRNVMFSVTTSINIMHVHNK